MDPITGLTLDSRSKKSFLLHFNLVARQKLLILMGDQMDYHSVDPECHQSGNPRSPRT